ncbi:MAG: dTDP-4-dehydrorhamnose 3,5-epimerase-like enzyme [Actinomycetia bacterium]|nr:dTDP-4-dehydrorhamnose 3,5-epimerase-like enzyme [Actinomycetes bacterium]
MIAGVVVHPLTIHADERGRFIETYRKEWVPGAREMIQANRGDRQAGCVVGLHFHRKQADWWYVVEGSARVVLHDLRVGSPTDGETMVFDQTADVPTGVYIPPGVAHGFASLSDVTLTYLVDGYYDPADELGVAWDDPAIGAEWGLTAPVLSARDQALPARSAVDLPVFAG